jgi:energy-coupling factor transport system ATP-binding protein
VLPRAGVTLLTGPRGSGKTTACRALVAEMRGAGRRVGGVVCPARLRDGVKVGIDVVEVAGGRRRQLATKAGDDTVRGNGRGGELALGAWSFDREALAWADEALAATSPLCDLVVVDELGPLELLRGEGFTAALDLVDAGRGLVVAVVREELLDVARARWPLAQVRTPDELTALGVGAQQHTPVADDLPQSPAPARPAVRLHDLSVTFGRRSALSDVTLDIAPGELVLVTGPSGCGKSTLARVMAGLVPRVLPGCVEGAVRVAGVDPVSAGPAATARHVGMVSQDPSSQLFCLSVDEELAFGPRNLGLDAAEVAARVEWAATACSLEHLRARAPASLSGGEQQRVATAAVLTMRPEVLVLDEPLAGLDARGVRALLATLERLNRDEGVTVVLIEHRLTEVVRLARRVVVLERGRIAADGPVREILSDDDLCRRLGLRRPAFEPIAEWEDLLVPSPLSADGDVVLRAEHVAAGYGRRHVLRAVDLELRRGELVALVGENGSGKSTLARVLAGLKRPGSGRVTFPGLRKPRPGVDVGLLLQDPGDQLLTDEVDAEVALGPRSWGCFDPAAHDKLLAVSDLLDLRRFAPLSLSVGQQQRTVLAAVLALGPRVVILDEPTHGQDWAHLERLVAFLGELRERGSAILLITHDFTLAHFCADRVAILRAGRISAQGVFARSEGRASCVAPP